MHYGYHSMPEDKYQSCHLIFSAWFLYGCTIICFTNFPIDWVFLLISLVYMLLQNTSLFRYFGAPHLWYLQGKFLKVLDQSTYCYRQNICAPPKFVCWNPDPRCGGIRRYRTFGRWLGYERGTLMNGISALVKQIWESSVTPSAMWRCSEKIAIYEPESRLLPDTESSQPSELWEMFVV